MLFELDMQGAPGVFAGGDSSAPPTLDGSSAYQRRGSRPTRPASETHDSSEPFFAPF